MLPWLENFKLDRSQPIYGLTARLNANVNATGDLGFVIPSYVFATPVLGGQASVSLVSAYDVVSTTLAGQLAGSLTGPGGGSIPFMRSDSFNDTTWGFGDLIPQFALRWADVPRLSGERGPQSDTGCRIAC